MKYIKYIKYIVIIGVLSLLNINASNSAAGNLGYGYECYHNDEIAPYYIMLSMGTCPNPPPESHSEQSVPHVGPDDPECIIELIEGIGE